MSPGERPLETLFESLLCFQKIFCDDSTWSPFFTFWDLGTINKPVLLFAYIWHDFLSSCIVHANQYLMGKITVSCWVYFSLLKSWIFWPFTRSIFCLSSIRSVFCWLVFFFPSTHCLFSASYAQASIIRCLVKSRMFKVELTSAASFHFNSIPASGRDL